MVAAHHRSGPGPAGGNRGVAPGGAPLHGLGAVLLGLAMVAAGSLGAVAVRGRWGSGRTGLVRVALMTVALVLLGAGLLLVLRAWI